MTIGTLFIFSEQIHRIDLHKADVRNVHMQRSRDSYYARGGHRFDPGMPEHVEEHEMGGVTSMTDRDFHNIRRSEGRRMRVICLPPYDRYATPYTAEPWSAIMTEFQVLNRERVSDYHRYNSYVDATTMESVYYQPLITSSAATATTTIRHREIPSDIHFRFVIEGHKEKIRFV